MKSHLQKVLTIFVLVAVTSLTLNAQEGSESSTPKKKCDIDIVVGADIMSRYIWRGTDYGDSPSIQPTLAVTINNFEIGCWSAIATNNNYKEIDIYAKYTLKKFSITLTDYYIPFANGVSSSPDNRYFVYGNKKTAHTLEASLQYKAGEKFPLWVTGGIFFYGNDKRWGYNTTKDNNETTYFSSYLEMGYTFTKNENSADVFVGFTPYAGAYGSKLGFVNIGVTGTKNIKITDSYELPVKASLIFNPQTSAAFFAFGITL
jgi:hypothetical protein